MVLDAKTAASFLGAAVAFAALVYAVRRNNRNDAREATRAKRGALRATFGAKALTIRNEGQASARSITLTLNGVPAAESDLFNGRTVQIGTIAAGASASLPFVVWDGMPRQHDVVVTWDDESGERGSWEAGLTIP